MGKEEWVRRSGKRGTINEAMDRDEAADINAAPSINYAVVFFFDKEKKGVDAREEKKSETDVSVNRDSVRAK